MKLNFTKTFLAIGTSALFSSVFGQVTFTDNTGLLVNGSLSSGVAIGIADMNGDGMDDLVRLSGARSLEVEYQSTGGTWTALDWGSLNGPGPGSNAWAFCVGDYDRNGYNDIFAGGAYNGLKLLTANASGTDYTKSLLTGPSIFVQASNFADIDNNGTLDIFSCHDDGLSSSYTNDGAGNLTYDLGLINAVSTIPSDNSGNYGTCWTDYDNDGDLDMYLSKCRLGVTNPLDGRRVNMLFQNDGNGNYTDVAEAAGLRPLAQSWAADFSDIDNDGDLDAFVLNHDITSQFYINNGDGTFTDITAASGVTSELASLGLGIQCKFTDFDNDGFTDMFLTGRDGVHYILWNDGDLTFTAGDPFSTSGMQSAAVGDLNHDGYVDVLAGYANGFNSPSTTADVMYLNDGNNANNFYSIQLTGTTSNINAIAAKVEIYGAWGQQLREVRAGESYGVFHSFTMHFGLGTATAIDSVIIRWPSGTVNKICSPAINQFQQYTENTNPTIAAAYSSSANSLNVDFTDMTTVSTPTGWSWDFGDGTPLSTAQNPSHTFPSSGLYTVCLTSTDGCFTDVICQDILINACVQSIPGFSFTPNGIGTIDFTDASIENSTITSYSWDFGDGTPASSAQNPTHVYASSATFSVCLTITDGCGTDISCQDVSICIPSVSGFSYTPNGLSTIDFTNASIENSTITSYSWDFGDGTTSSATNITHGFISAGTYTVCLTITDGCGSDVICQDVIVTCPVPSAGFNTSGNGFETVNFTDASTSADLNASYTWDFGDGSAVDNSQSPTHIYTQAGVYSVCLTVDDQCGSNTTCQDVTIQIVGIDESELNLFSISPNPSNGLFNIEMNSSDKASTVSVQNVLGKEILTSEINDGKFQVNIINEANGVYFITINNQSNSSTLRVIKK